jgi:hypothetical protein
MKWQKTKLVTAKVSKVSSTAISRNKKYPNMVEAVPIGAASFFGAMCKWAVRGAEAMPRHG